ncbi:hypothetical protein B0H11DRAFT_1903504 [Mycena galericulata]|nr:hypothetical protein B0H11DRAFT_1903504 [Mycena galericulata]
MTFSVLLPLLLVEGSTHPSMRKLEPEITPTLVFSLLASPNQNPNAEYASRIDEKIYVPSVGRSPSSKRLFGSDLTARSRGRQSSRWMDGWASGRAGVVYAYPHLSPTSENSPSYVSVQASLGTASPRCVGGRVPGPPSGTTLEASELYDSLRTLKAGKSTHRQLHPDPEMDGLECSEGIPPRPGDICTHAYTSVRRARLPRPEGGSKQACENRDGACRLGVICESGAMWYGLEPLPRRTLSTGLTCAGGKKPKRQTQEIGDPRWTRRRAKLGDPGTR